MSEDWDYVASDRRQVARKAYQCEACDDLAEAIDSAGIEVLTWAQRELWEGVKTEACRILPGERYRKVTGVVCGQWAALRGRLDALYLLDAIERWEAADCEAVRVHREHLCVSARPDLYSAERCAEASRALAKYAAERLAARPVARSRS